MFWTVRLVDICVLSFSPGPGCLHIYLHITLPTERVSDRVLSFWSVLFAQRISLAVERGNAASIIDTIPDGQDLYSN